MGGKNANWICSFGIGTALVDELVDDAFGADIQEVDEERRQRVVVIQSAFDWLSLSYDESAYFDRSAGNSALKRLLQGRCDFLNLSCMSGLESAFKAR